MTTIQTGTMPDRWAFDDAAEDEQDAMLADAARDLRDNNPCGRWMDQIVKVILTDEEGDYYQCADCGVPEGEICAWCGCDCERITEAAPSHPQCVTLYDIDGFLKEWL